MKEYGIVSGDKVEKYHIALLFDKSTTSTPDWVQLSKSTENTITLNAETEDRDFITDKNPTTIVKRYKPSLNNPLTLFKGSEDYEYFFPIFYNMPTGADAEGTVLVVFMNAPTTNNNEYLAWKCGVTFVLDNLDPVNSQLTFTMQFNGTVDKGVVKVTDGTPAYTSGEPVTSDSE